MVVARGGVTYWLPAYHSKHPPSSLVFAVIQKLTTPLPEITLKTGTTVAHPLPAARVGETKSSSGVFRLSTNQLRATKKKAGLVAPRAFIAHGVARRNTLQSSRGVEKKNEEGEEEVRERETGCGCTQARVNMTACQSASSRSEKRERTSSTPASSRTVRCRAGWSNTSLSGIGGCDRGR